MSRISFQIAFVLLTTTAIAQTFTANVTGIVKDQNGGVVPNVLVKIKNTGTNEERQTRTQSEGRYTFSQLLPGTYQLTAESPGFRGFVGNNIRLVASQTGSFDITLELGEVAQHVVSPSVSGRDRCT